MVNDTPDKAAPSTQQPTALDVPKVLLDRSASPEQPPADADIEAVLTEAEETRKELKLFRYHFTGTNKKPAVPEALCRERPSASSLGLALWMTLFKKRPENNEPPQPRSDCPERTRPRSQTF